LVITSYLNIGGIKQKTGAKAGFAIGSLCTSPTFQGKATKYWHIDLHRMINNSDAVINDVKYIIVAINY